MLHTHVLNCGGRAQPSSIRVANAQPLFVERQTNLARTAPKQATARGT
jgi:hypothetical protein